MQTVKFFQHSTSFNQLFHFRFSSRPLFYFFISFDKGKNDFTAKSCLSANMKWRKKLSMQIWSLLGFDVWPNTRSQLGDICFFHRAVVWLHASSFKSEIKKLDNKIKNYFRENLLFGVQRPRSMQETCCFCTKMLFLILLNMKSTKRSECQTAEMLLFRV